MTYFLVLSALTLTGIWFLRVFVKANPATLADSLRQLAGYLAVLLALGALVSGRFAAMAFPLAIAAFLLLSKKRFPSFGGTGRSSWSRPKSGQASTVRSAYFDMTLDHASGTMDGEILHGVFAGRQLSSLTAAELQALHRSLLRQDTGDPDSLSLLEAYLDSVLPTWREDFDTGTADGQGTAARSGTISEKEAYEILGLAPGASESEIRAAHRRLILETHPDRGGSTDLAARINEAKDILLRNHSSAS